MPTSFSAYSVLFAQEDRAQLLLFSTEWQRASLGVPLYTAHSLLMAEAILRSGEPPVRAAVVPLHVGDQGALEFVAGLRRMRPELWILVTSGISAPPELEATYAAGADAFVRHEISIISYVSAVHEAVRARLGEG